MSQLRLLIPVILLGLFAACGQPADRKAPANEAAVELPEAATEAPADTRTQAIEEAMVEESSGETGESAEQLATRLAASSEPQPAGSRQWRFSPGKHYSQLTSAQGTTAGAGGIEVAEVFWYGCPHCYNFDPYVERWQAALPQDVRFVRLPVKYVTDGPEIKSFDDMLAVVDELIERERQAL